MLPNFNPCIKLNFGTTEFPYSFGDVSQTKYWAEWVKRYAVRWVPLTAGIGWGAVSHDKYVTVEAEKRAVLLKP